MPALNQFVGVAGHIIPEIIKPELIIGAKGDISQVSIPACRGIGLVLIDTIDLQTVKLIQHAHPFRVTLGQVVIYRNDMHPFPWQRIQIYR